MRKSKRMIRIEGVLGIFILVSLFTVGGSGEFQITFDPAGQGFPAIYGDIVVWEDDRNGNWDIYGCRVLIFFRCLLQSKSDTMLITSQFFSRTYHRCIPALTFS